MKKGVGQAPATPCKGESGKLGGRRIGGDYREGLAHLEANARDDAYSTDHSKSYSCNQTVHQSVEVRKDYFVN